MVELSDNAVIVLEARYLVRDEHGKIIETPSDMFRRVANAVAVAEHDDYQYSVWADRFYRAMTSLEFMPNSPTLMNAGLPKAQLSACFVCGIEDSMESIFEALKKAALITKSGGGVGFDFSSLRPEGAQVKSTAGVASGPISFMKVFDGAIDAIKQGGRRRGACMGILRVDHPNIFEFITCKAEDKILSNFNISVAVTDEFMDALNAGRPFPLRFGGKTYKTVDPQRLWDLIVHQAWLNGEPGVVFIDVINEHNPVPHLGRIASVNPCGRLYCLR